MDFVPVDQTTFHNPPQEQGNCLAACLASLTGVDIEDQPDWSSLPIDTWFTDMANWLWNLGWDLETSYSDTCDPPSGVAIAIGPGPRGIHHAVIVYDGDLIHDPHPSRGGLTECRGWWQLVPMSGQE